MIFRNASIRGKNSRTKKKYFIEFRLGIEKTKDLIADQFIAVFITKFTIELNYI
jgi:hypothetical protein